MATGARAAMGQAGETRRGAGLPPSPPLTPSPPRAGRDEAEWEPPSEAELKVIQARRERQDKISKLMSDYLLKGYRMLGDCCDECGVSGRLRACTGRWREGGL